MPALEEPLIAPTPGMDSAFDSIDNLQGDDAPPEKPPADAAAPVVPEANPDAKPEIKPEDAKPAPNEPDDDLPRAKKKEPEVEKPKAQPAPEVKPSGKETVPELRRNYEATKTERDTLKAEVEKLRGEQKTWREEGKKSATAEVQAEIEQLRKQVADYDVKVRYLNYAESNEFKEKYQEPLKKAWKAAAEDVNGFKYTDETGAEQEATIHDVAALMKMNATSAANAATRMFGAAAPEILAHRRELVRLTQASEGALQEFRQKGSERSAEEARQQQNAQQQAREFYENHLGLLRKERVEFFGDDPNDADGNAFIKKGDVLVRRALLGEGIPEGITPQERAEIRIKAQAEVAARAAAFGRERHRVIRLQEENETLKKQIASFQKSEPDASDTKGKQSGAKKTGWEASNQSLDDLQGI